MEAIRITHVEYVADDGTVFYARDECLNYEKKNRAFWKLVRSKIGPYDKSELWLGGPNGEAKLNSLPFEAPWMSGMGACFINVTDLRRNKDGEVEFQLAYENCVPYDDGDAWVLSDAFHQKWPD